LKLSLAKNDIPVDTWKTIIGLQQLYVDGLNSTNVLTGLAAQDSALLENYRVSPALIDIQSTEIKILRAMLDPSVQQSANSGDFKAYLTALSNTGLLDVPETSKLGERVRQYIIGNQSDYQSIIASLDNVDTAIASNYSATPNVFPVIVGVVAVLISVAVVAVLAAATATVAIVNMDVARYQASSLIPHSKILSMHPDEYEKMQNAVRTAHLVGGKSLVRSAYDYIVDEESNAMSDALIEIYFMPRGRADEVTVQAVRSSVKATLTRLYGLS
jgi:hypothetical protein